MVILVTEMTSFSLETSVLGGTKEKFKKRKQEDTKVFIKRGRRRGRERQKEREKQGKKRRIREGRGKERGREEILLCQSVFADSFS